MTSTRSFSISTLKTIKLSLWGGNFRLKTHSLPQIDILPHNMTDASFASLVPIITEQSDHIEIGGQRGSSFAPQKEKVDIDVLLPEYSNVVIDCTGGAFQVSGKYSSLHASLFAGEFVWWYPATALKEGSVKMWFGDLRVLVDPEDKIVFEKNNFWNKNCVINDEVRISCGMKVAGNVEIREPNSKEESKRIL